MAKKFKIFHGSVMHRGCQFYVSFYANSQKEAAALINTTLSDIQKYYSCVTHDVKEFDGIMAYTDRFEYPDIRNKKMPLDELKKIIDERRDKEWAEFRKENRL